MGGPVDPLDPEVLAAMASCHFHARYPSADFVPTEFRPMGVDRAVAILGEDTSGRGKRRAVRAFTAIATGVDDDPSLARAGLDAKQLGAGLREVLEASRHEVATHPRPARRARYAKSDPDEGLLDGIVERIAGFLGLEPKACERTFPVSKPHFDFGTATASVETWIKVKRPLAGLARTFDPQLWDECSDFFVETRSLDAPAPTPGSDWNGRLFEHFRMSVGAAQLADFEVELEIDATPRTDANGDRHEIDYRIVKALRAELGGQTPPHGDGLSIDDGFVRVDPVPGDPGWHRVHALKAVKLRGWGTQADFWMTFWSSLGFWALSAETYDFVCCAP